MQTVAGTNGRGLGYIYAGRVIAGIGVGAISAVAPAFVSECSPKNVRGRITGLFQIMVAIGVMVSYFVNCELPLIPNPLTIPLTAFLDGIGIHMKTGVDIWRVPFGLQLVPCGIMLLGLLTVKARAPLSDKSTL